MSARNARCATTEGSRKPDLKLFAAAPPIETPPLFFLIPTPRLYHPNATALIRLPRQPVCIDDDNATKVRTNSYVLVIKVLRLNPYV